MSQAVEEAVAGHESLDISEVEVLDMSVCREAIEVKVRNICASVLEFSDSQVDVLDISACTSQESTVVTPIADATVLLEDACREGVAAGGLSARSKEDPVLSLVSLNIKTAASFDLVRGSLAVLPELPSAVAAQAKTVRVSCGRDAGNTIVLADSRVSSLHFTLRVRAAKGGLVSLELQDQSSNGTWVNGRRVGKGRKVALAVGDQVVVLPASQVGRHAETGYLLIHDIRGARCSSALSCGEMELEGDAKAGGSSSSTAEAVKRDVQPLSRLLDPELRCAVCTEALHQCLTIVPCGHNFCAACLLRWRKNSPACPKSGAGSCGGDFSAGPS